MPPNWLIRKQPTRLLAPLFPGTSLPRTSLPRGLYTLSMREWTFLSPSGLIQSASLLGRRRSGLSLKELSASDALAHLASLHFPSVSAGRLPQHIRLPLHGHAAFTALWVLLGRPTARHFSLPTSLALIGSVPRCHPRPRRALPGSRTDLPYRAVRKHLGAVGG